MKSKFQKSYGSLLDIGTLVAVHLINKCSKDSLQQYCLANSPVRVKEYGFPLGVIRLVEDIENFSHDLKAIIVILIQSYLLDIATWEALSKRINRKVLHENFHNLVLKKTLPDSHCWVGTNGTCYVLENTPIKLNNFWPFITNFARSGDWDQFNTFRISEGALHEKLMEEIEKLLEKNRIVETKFSYLIPFQSMPNDFDEDDGMPRYVGSHVPQGNLIEHLRFVRINTSLYSLVKSRDKTRIRRNNNRNKNNEMLNLSSSYDESSDDENVDEGQHFLPSIRTERKMDLNLNNSSNKNNSNKNVGGRLRAQQKNAKKKDLKMVSESQNRLKNESKIGNLISDTEKEHVYKLLMDKKNLYNRISQQLVEESEVKEEKFDETVDALSLTELQLDEISEKFDTITSKYSNSSKNRSGPSKISNSKLSDRSKVAESNMRVIRRRAFILSQMHNQYYTNITYDESGVKEDKKIMNQYQKIVNWLMSEKIVDRKDVHKPIATHFLGKFPTDQKKKKIPSFGFEERGMSEFPVVEHSPSIDFQPEEVPLLEGARCELFNIAPPFRHGSNYLAGLQLPNTKVVTRPEDTTSRENLQLTKKAIDQKKKKVQLVEVVEKKTVSVSEEPPPKVKEKKGKKKKEVKEKKTKKTPPVIQKTKELFTTVKRIYSELEMMNLKLSTDGELPIQTTTDMINMYKIEEGFLALIEKFKENGLQNGTKDQKMSAVNSVYSANTPENKKTSSHGKLKTISSPGSLKDSRGSLNSRVKIRSEDTYFPTILPTGKIGLSVNTNKKFDISTYDDDTCRRVAERYLLYRTLVPKFLKTNQDASLLQREMFIRILSDESSYRTKKQVPNTTRSGNYITDTIAWHTLDWLERTRKLLENYVIRKDTYLFTHTGEQYSYLTIIKLETWQKPRMKPRKSYSRFKRFERVRKDKLEDNKIKRTISFGKFPDEIAKKLEYERQCRMSFERRTAYGDGPIRQKQIE
ncbi:hypothetical protein SNEBB_010680, partial [Seison nebaliae]